MKGKGDRDRRVPLPAVVRQELATWLSQVKRIHARDLAEGFGSVYLPYGELLARRDLKTTMIYTNVLNRAGGRGIRSPADTL